MAKFTLPLPDPAATVRLGHFLAKHLRTGDVIALNGPLGAGKSELARAIIAFHNPDELDIPSPTFTLVQTYALADGTPLLHFDMYRLDDPSDAIELGVEDAFYDGVALVEWPEKIAPFMPPTALSCVITINADASRTIAITANAHWAERLAGLESLDLSTA